MEGIIYPSIRWGSVLPFIVVILAGVAALLKGFLGRKQAGLSYSDMAMLGVCLALVLTMTQGNRGPNLSFGQMLVVDNLAIGFNFLFLLTTALTILFSVEFLRRMDQERPEYYALLLFATVGMMSMASSGDLLVIFLGLETMSIALYILAGYTAWSRCESDEAALKYLLLGAFATGFLLYGIAFVYGAAGSTALTEVPRALTDAAYLLAHPASHTFLMIGLGLLLIGFAFKVAAVPFHQWVPDVYEGAPTCVTAFMSVGPKVAGFAVLLRVFSLEWGIYALDQARLLAILAVLTMLVGNLSALVQMNIKRMLAYSSIAHVGYLLVGVTAGGEAGRQSVLFYGLAYAFMNLGAFIVVLLIGGGREENLHLDDYKGLWVRQPLLAGSMAIFMFSLAGIPLTGGFYGKYLLFSAAVGAGYVSLAVLGVLCSLLSVFFYFRVVWYMFMQQPSGELTIEPHPIARNALYICLAGVFWLGLLPHWFFLKLVGGATLLAG